MEELGRIITPELYAPIGADCLIEDTVKAKAVFYQIFGNQYDNEAQIMLAYVLWPFSSIPPILAWVYFVPEKDSVMLASVFDNDGLDEIDYATHLMEIHPIQNESFFYRNDELCAIVMTSNQKQVIRKVKLLLTESDMFTVYGNDNNDCVFAAKLYDYDSGKFLLTCWVILTDNTICFYPISLDEQLVLDQIDLDKCFFNPVMLNETAIIGNEYYKLHCNNHFGYYFKKLPFLVTKAIREMEDIERPVTPQISQPETQIFEFCATRTSTDKAEVNPKVSCPIYGMNGKKERLARHPRQKKRCDTQDNQPNPNAGLPCADWPQGRPIICSTNGENSVYPCK